MMRFLRLLAWSFITAGIVIAAIGGALYWLYRDAEAPGPLAAARTLVIAGEKDAGTPVAMRVSKYGRRIVVSPNPGGSRSGISVSASACTSQSPVC